MLAKSKQAVTNPDNYYYLAHNHIDTPLLLTYDYRKLAGVPFTLRTCWPIDRRCNRIRASLQVCMPGR